jgi:hypothetical protein
LPSIRSSGDRAGQFEDRAGLREKWNDHVLRSWVVGSANWDSLGKRILDVDISVALDAKSVDVAVGLVKLSILAKQATVRLATSGLEVRPLSLGVTRWASIRAKTTLLTIWLGSTTNMSLLDTSPLVVTDPFDWDSSVLRWEVTAVNFTVWERSINAGWTSSGGLLGGFRGWLRTFGGGGWLVLGLTFLLFLVFLVFLVFLIFLVFLVPIMPLLDCGGGREGRGGWSPWLAILVDGESLGDGLGAGDAPTHVVLVTYLSNGMSVDGFGESGGRGGEKDGEGDKVAGELHCDVVLGIRLFGKECDFDLVVIV